MIRCRLAGRRLAVSVSFALCLFAFGLAGVSAQTATPTPTPTATATATPNPWYGTWPTPVPTPTGLGTTGAVWGCKYIVDNGVAQPAQCTWGNEFSLIHINNAYLGEDTEYITYLLISPPSNAKTITFDCSVSYTKTYYGPDHQRGMSTNYDVGEKGSELKGDYTSASLPDLSGLRTITETSTLKNVGGAWADWSYVPDGLTTIDLTDYPQAMLRSVLVTSGSGSVEFVAGLACYVQVVELKDGTTYSPPANTQIEDSWPTPTPTATVDACLPWEECWLNWSFTPVGITPVPVATVAQTITFGLGEPAAPECFTIVPGQVISETVFSYAIDAGWNDYEVCVQEQEFSFSVFDINIGNYIALALGVMAVGVVFAFWGQGG